MPEEVKPLGSTTGAVGLDAGASFSLVGQIGGQVSDAVVVDHLVFVAIGPRIVAYDVSVPASPRVVSQTKVLAGVVEDLDAGGSLAAAGLGEGGLAIFDLSEPSRPQVLGEVDTPEGEVTSVAVVGRAVAAAVAGDPPAVWMTEIEDAAAPRVMAMIELPAAAYGLAGADDVLYFLVEGEGLRVVDVSDPSSPEPLAALAFPDGEGGAEGKVHLESGYAFVADGASGLRILDVVDPLAPKALGRLADLDDARGVFTTNGFAYVADGQDGVALVEITDLRAPRLTSRLATAGPAGNVFVAEDWAYVADSLGVRVLDVGTPRAPRAVGAIESPAYPVGASPAGRHTFVLDGAQGRVWAIDLAQPDAPRVAGVIDVPLAGRESSAISAAGGYAFVAAGERGLAILDVRDPAAMSLLGGLDTVTPFDVHAADGRVYLASGRDGLELVDVADPRRPRLRGSYKSGGYATSAFAQGGRALVLDDAELHVVDSSDPDALRAIGVYPVTDPSDGAVSAVGDRGYLAAERFQVLDLSRPGKPGDTGAWRPWDEPLVAPRVAVAGERAYTSDRLSGYVWALDLAPPNPREVGRTRLPAGSLAVDMVWASGEEDGDLVVVAGGNGGLGVLRYSGQRAAAIFLPVAKKRVR